GLADSRARAADRLPLAPLHHPERGVLHRPSPAVPHPAGAVHAAGPAAGGQGVGGGVRHARLLGLLPDDGSEPGALAVRLAGPAAGGRPHLPLATLDGPPAVAGAAADGRGALGDVRAARLGRALAGAAGRRLGLAV